MTRVRQLERRFDRSARSPVSESYRQNRRQYLEAEEEIASGVCGQPPEAI
jgi:hypothetical protein